MRRESLPFTQTGAPSSGQAEICIGDADCPRLVYREFLLFPKLKTEDHYIAELIIDGEITVGTLVPVGCVAIATDGHNTLAMLKCREGETLAQLLTRLDLAIGKAFTEDVFTDEINTPLRNSHRR